MKKLSIATSLLLLFSFVFAVHTAKAQDVAYTWEEFGVSFIVPKTHV